MLQKNEAGGNALSENSRLAQPPLYGLGLEAGVVAHTSAFLAAPHSFHITHLGVLGI